MKLNKKNRNSAKVNPSDITEMGLNVYHIGRETLVTITLEDIGVFGRSRALCDDKYSDAVGEGIALGRALQDFGKAVEKKWLDRSVSKAEYQAKHHIPENFEHNSDCILFISRARGAGIHTVGKPNSFCICACHPVETPSEKVADYENSSPNSKSRGGIAP